MNEETNIYSFNNVRRTSTVEVIVQNLIDLIGQRSLQPGDKLPPERELCEIIGVSRPVLRESLKALQVMNIVSIRQGAGAFVRNLEPENVIEHLDIVFHLDSSLYHDLYEARRIIEGELARLAAARITESELAAIEENVRQAINSTDDADEFLKMDLEMHDMILKASRNRVMPVFMQSINKLVMMAREKTNAQPDVRKHTIQDHAKILNALKAHDEDAARQAMDMHIINVAKSVLGNVEE